MGLPSLTGSRDAAWCRADATLRFADHPLDTDLCYTDDRKLREFLQRICRENLKKSGFAVECELPHKTAMDRRLAHESLTY